MECIANLSWIVLPQPSHRSDLEPSDFHMFRMMQDGLRGQHFPKNEAVVENVGHLQWYSFLQAQHAGSCSSLEKLYS